MHIRRIQNAFLLFVLLYVVHNLSQLTTLTPEYLLRDILKKFDKTSELHYLKQVEKSISYRDRKEFAEKHDKIHELFENYISSDEYDKYVKYINPLILHLKKHFNFPRPHELDASLKYVHLDSANTRSFPSGHSTQAHYLYLCILRDKGIDLKHLSEAIRLSRILALVHYPIDDLAGVKLAEWVFQNRA